MKIGTIVVVALAVTAALLVTKTCSYREGRADERLLAQDDFLNAVILAQRTAADSAVRVFDAARDSTGRVIAALRSRIVRRDTIRITDTVTVSEQLALRDSLIAELESGRRSDSLQILFWRATVESRDTLVSQLQTARDLWRQEAQQPRYTVTDIGGALIVGYGVAEKCSECLAVGGATILLPRLYGAVRQLF